MTLPTPREAAEALFNKLANFSASNAKDRINGKVAIIEAAFAARDRALLAEPSWKCFHCNETFTDRDAAIEHFGVYESQEPACQIDIPKYREMEELHARNLTGDTERDRVIYRLQTEHPAALRREEEKGYACGLRDARAELLAEDEATIEAMDEAICRVQRPNDHPDNFQGCYRPHARAALAALRRHRGVEP